jgi:hypothetical protein
VRTEPWRSTTTPLRKLHIDPFASGRDVGERISAHPANPLDELLPDRCRAARIAATSR